jgi:Ion channel
MLSLVLVAVALVAVTVAVHAVGIAVMLRAMRRWVPLPPTHLWPITRLLISITWCLILLHLVEISMWALFYLWWGCLPDTEAAFYFAGVTYTSIGYGDLVLAKPWRLFAPIEGLTGILMCGLSASFLFALVLRIHQEYESTASIRRQGGTQR